jgi:hypothetical protein
LEGKRNSPRRLLTPARAYNLRVESQQQQQQPGGEGRKKFIFLKNLFIFRFSSFLTIFMLHTFLMGISLSVLPKLALCTTRSVLSFSLY